MQIVMNSKYKLLLILLIVIILLLGAGGYLLNNKYNWFNTDPAMPEYNYTPDQFTELDLSIFDTRKNKRIYYGMNKSETERIVGESVGERLGFTASDSLEFLEYSDGLSIVYRLDRAVAFYIDTTEHNRFVTMRNIGLENGLNDDLVAYGLKPTSTDAGFDTYLIEKMEDKYKKLNVISYEENHELTVYNISFQKENGKLISISISDMLFTKNFK